MVLKVTLKRSRKELEETYPNLMHHGLIIIRVEADGNCLFRALSDQLYGHQDEHLNIRALVVEEMRANREQYEPHLVVDGERRQPKRQCRGSKKVSIDAAEATQNQKDRAWNQRLALMSKPREWADSLEIKAFANKFGVNVRVWRKEGSEAVFLANKRFARNQRALNIVFHEWQHYDSVFPTSHATLEALKAMADDSAPQFSTPSEEFAVQKLTQMVILDDSDSKFIPVTTPVKPVKTIKKPVEVIVLEDSDSDALPVKKPSTPKIRARNMSAAKKDNQGATIIQMKMTAKEEYMNHLHTQVTQLVESEIASSGKEN